MNVTEEACSHDIITVRAGVACNVQVLKFHVLLLWQRFWGFGMATSHPKTCQVNSGSPSWPFKRREQYNKNCLKQIQKWRLSYGSDSPSESETMVITAPPIKYHYATVILPCVISNRCQMLQVLEYIRHRPVFMYIYWYLRHETTIKCTSLTSKIWKISRGTTTSWQFTRFPPLPSNAICPCTLRATYLVLQQPLWNPHTATCVGTVKPQCLCHYAHKPWNLMPLLNGD